MNIRWLGHSCFLITSGNGMRILTDPFDKTVGYEIPAVEADIVLISHEHFDHNAVNLVKGNPEVVRKPGEYKIKGIDIKGISSFHDATEGSKRGHNTIFVFKVDNICVSHLGDLGHILQPEHIKDIGYVDILLIPVGGFYTIDSEQATRVVQQINPKIIIPMHYKTSAINIPIESVDKFLAGKSNIQYIDSNELTITCEQIPEEPTIIILKYE
ncbi:MAG: metal-dependent hydrolase [candidate division TA06 bacterium ADurb.Bin131]|uniref:Metal-dependent hydrolase n=1 Tax=candidate division TA06 bacterium ADurb.Bin131 TaxID=1852827 RepID=A0A1V6CDF8_UNCT6|nr:MAG: metal-dependent hydrolase [candidate division TA06 bacterium ADurb.Bin131]